LKPSGNVFAHPLPPLSSNPTIFKAGVKSQLKTRMEQLLSLGNQNDWSRRNDNNDTKSSEIKNSVNLKYELPQPESKAESMGQPWRGHKYDTFQATMKISH
jgi:hypothetical protein